MSPVLRFTVFQSMIILPFAAGFLLRNRFTSPGAFTKKLVTANLVTIEPAVALWSIWGLQLTAEAAVLPAAGVAMVLLGMAGGLMLLPLVRKQRQSRITFLISSSLANHGFTMGGFICYLLLGERGLGLSFIYISYFMLYLYLVIFPVARFASNGGNEPPPVREFFISFRNMPLYAILVAIALNVSGIRRPGVFFPTDALLLLSVAVYYFTLGMNFKTSDIRATVPEAALTTLLKFCLVPLATWGALSLLSLPQDIRSVILIQSFMPAAIYSVITAVLFDLDTGLASGIFVTNTVFFILIVVPALVLAFSR